jgi:hypothetical protein
MRDGQDRIPPWAHGPAELFRHAEEHYQANDDTDRRLALIGFDNTIEVCIDAFLGLHPRQRGDEISREQRENARRNYHTKIEFLEGYLAERGRFPHDLSLDEVLWYHQLRNELYHSGNGMIPETQHILGIRAAARSIFRALFGRDLLPELAHERAITTPSESPVAASESGGARLAFLSAFIELERALAQWSQEEKGRVPISLLWSRFADAQAWAATYMHQFGEARNVRNAIARGDEVPVSEEALNDLTVDVRHLADRIQNTPPATRPSLIPTLRGRQLAQAAWRTAQRRDGNREGLTTVEVLDAIAADGVDIGGANPARALYHALNNAHDLFARERGRFRWKLEPEADELRVGLSGIALLDALADECGWINEAAQGRHYQAITQRLQSLGIPVKGPNMGRTTYAALSYGVKRGSLVRTGRGTFRCLDE